MRRSLLLLLPVALLATSCLSLRVGPSTSDEDDFFELDGVGDAYAGIVDADDHQSYGIDVLSGLGRGEVAAVDLGPVFGLGVGVAGVRFHLWPFEFGVSTLAYDAKSAGRRYSKRRDRHDDEDDTVILVDDGEVEVLDEDDLEHGSRER